MKYTIITQRCHCHLFVEALLRAVEKHLSPDEIIVASNTKIDLGGLMHRQILKAKNDYFLMLDQDILIFDNTIVEEMYRQVSEPNVLASGALELDWNQDGCAKILVASCNMVDKKRYFGNGIPFYASEPCLDAFGTALCRGQKLVKVGKSWDTTFTGPEVFHLNQGFKTLYSDITISNWWKNSFEKWKSISGSKEVFEDYVIDDGADYTDQMQVSSLVARTIIYAPEIRRPISIIRLEDDGVEFLNDYFSGKQVNRKIAEELIEYVKTSTWLDHSHILKGCFNTLYDEQLASKYSNLYKRIGVVFRQESDFSGRYCSPLQNYLFFVKDFEINFRALVEGKRVRYAGPYDAMGELNKKKDLGMQSYEYCQISNDYNSISQFFENFKVNDWDVVFVSGGLYANIIVGRVKKLGCIGVNIGDAIFFNPSDKIKQVLTVAEDGISYILKDGYPNYGKRLYEKYLMVE